MRLPPLPALRFFEAAGRRLSFKAAAEELNVTPSAVSHGVAALEEALGATLFIRETRRIVLTPVGADFLAHVSEAFALIAVGTQRLPSRNIERRISVTCAPSLAARWLVPRLGDFRARWPNVSVLVDTSRRQARFPLDGFDFAVRFARMPPAGPQVWVPLFGERLTPVCSAAYRAALADDQGRCDLRRATLIHVFTVSEDWAAWIQGAWGAGALGTDADADGRAGKTGAGKTGADKTGAGKAGAEPLNLKRGLSFDGVNMALDVAAAGMGVAVGRFPLAAADIKAGRLVEAGHPTVVSAVGYWLVCAEGYEDRPELAAFQRWLVEQARDFAAADYK